MPSWRSAFAALLLIWWLPPLAATGFPDQAVPSAAKDYLFQTATGLLVFHIRPDRARDFEAVLARVGQGLMASPDETRRKQAEGWRIFRSVDVGETAVYVVIVDPVVPGTDYDPVRMISEFVPAEAQLLYERLKSAVVRVERMGLERVP